MAPRLSMVGAHPHNVTLSPAEKQEMMGLVPTMVGLSYLNMEDVPQIPTRKTALQVAIYAPLAASRRRFDLSRAL
jgi:hypothetical protein